MKTEQKTGQLLSLRPTREDYFRAYSEPGVEDWTTISQEVFADSDFSVSSVEANPTINWPTPEQKEFDFAVFDRAIQFVMNHLHLSDEEYSKKLPELFDILLQSHLFKKSFPKQNGKHDATIGEHVQVVSSLTKTDGLSLADRMTLRIIAPFHDLAKAFDVGEDRLQYHALIASRVAHDILTQNQALITSHATILAEDQTFKEQLDNPAEAEALRDQLQTEYDDFVNQVSEIIRLHHVFENLDKGNLDLETVAAITNKENVNLILLGLFVLADGGGSVTQTEYQQYSQYLFDNIEQFGKLIDQIELMNQEPENYPEEVREVIIQALQNVLRDLIELIDELKSLFETIIDEVAECVSQSILRILSEEIT